jgi:RHS repeat-associated protein
VSQESRRLSQTTPVGTTSYAYDAGHRLTSVIAPDTSVTAYTYDANGNQLTAGADTFSYDAANRLTGATVGGVASSYAYLGDGRRASATKAGVTTGFVWDPNFGLPQLALERDAVGATLRTTTYGLGPLSVSEAGQTSYLHADRLGSIAATSTAAGNPGWAYRYDPFGAERRAEQLDPAAPASPSRFTGQLLDPTGLYHLRARQYDPGTGRFLSTDPVAAALTDPYVSSYAYVRYNTLRWRDPSGECIVICAVVGAAVGAVVGAGTYVADTAINHRDWDWGQFAAATGSLAVGGAITGATAGLAWAVLPAAAPAASTAALRITGTVITVEGSLLGWSARTITSGLAGNRLTRDRAALQLAASVANPVFGLTPWTGWGLDIIYLNSPWYRSTQGDK